MLRTAPRMLQTLNCKPRSLTSVSSFVIYLPNSFCCFVCRQQTKRRNRNDRYSLHCLHCIRKEICSKWIPFWDFFPPLYTERRREEVKKLLVFSSPSTDLMFVYLNSLSSQNSHLPTKLKHELLWMLDNDCPAPRREDAHGCGVRKEVVWGGMLQGLYAGTE